MLPEPASSRRGDDAAGLRQRFAELREAARALLARSETVGRLLAQLERSDALRRMRELRERAGRR